MKKIAAIAVVSASLMMGGCLSQEQYDAAIAESQSLRETMNSEAERHRQSVAALRTQLASASEGERESLEAQIAAHERLADQLAARAADLEKVLKAAEESGGETAGILESIGQQVLPFLPPGAKGPAVLVVGIGGLIARLVQRSQALKGVIGSIEKAKKESPEFADAFTKAAPVIAGNQPPSAQKAVDAVQAKRLSPI